MSAVYLASKFARHAELGGYAAQLSAAGIDVTSRWCVGTEHGTAPDGLDNPDMPRFALEDIEDVTRADTVVSFTAGAGGRGGRHVEFGMAVALGKRLIVVGPREHVFHTLPQVEQFDEWEQAFIALTEERAA